MDDYKRLAVTNVGQSNYISRKTCISLYSCAQDISVTTNYLREAVKNVLAEFVR